MAPSCPRCGLNFHRAPGQWLGSWFLSLCVVQAVLVVSIIGVVLMSWPDRPSWLSIAALVLVAVCVPVGFFPFSRTIWTAIDLMMRPLEWDEGVDPGVELEQIQRRWQSSDGHPSPGTGSSDDRDEP